jgi:trypsin
MGLGVFVDFSPFPYILQAAKVEFMNQSKCRTSYEQFGVTIKEGIMFCTGSRTGAADSCQGDSGGPIINQGSQHV